MTTPGKDVREMEKAKEEKGKKVWPRGHKPGAILDEWEARTHEPVLIFCFHDSRGLTWLLSYEVFLGDWRYVVQAHVHINSEGENVAGHCWISGVDGVSSVEGVDKVKTPQWVVDHAPVFDERIHSDKWYSNEVYKTKLYKDDYLKPHKIK